MTGDTAELDSSLVYLLDTLEERLTRYQIELHVNSGRRAVDANSSHYYGLAADIRCEGGWERMKIVESCLGLFERIGVYPNHIHVDVDSSRPRPVLWSGCYHPQEA